MQIGDCARVYWRGWPEDCTHSHLVQPLLLAIPILGPFEHWGRARHHMLAHLDKG